MKIKELLEAETTNQSHKWKVSYDIHGSNRDVPLYSRHLHVHAKDEHEAVNTVKTLVGGRNHKAERV